MKRFRSGNLGECAKPVGADECVKSQKRRSQKRIELQARLAALIVTLFGGALEEWC